MAMSSYYGYVQPLWLCLTCMVLLGLLMAMAMVCGVSSCNGCSLVQPKLKLSFGAQMSMHNGLPSHMGLFVEQSCLCLSVLLFMAR